ELRIAQAHIASHHRDVIGMALGAFAQETREGFATPMTCGPIARDQRFRPLLLQRQARINGGRRHADTSIRDSGSCTPNAFSRAANLAAVSATSASGCESATMPAPAYRRSWVPCRRAQRIATYQSPSPCASSQPTAPA